MKPKPMIRKLFQIITICAVLFLTSPMPLAMAQTCMTDEDCSIEQGEVCLSGQCGPKPIFEGGTQPEKTGVAGIECALISDATARNTCFECVKSGGSNCATPESKSSLTSTGSLRDLIFKYVNFALPYLALAAFIAFVYAGFLYVTAYGQEEQVGKAKKIMLYAVIGIVLVILSYGIVQLFAKGLAEGIRQ